MRLLMISGDRSILAGKRGAFWYTLEELSKHFERIDVICPHVFPHPKSLSRGERDFSPPSPIGRRVGDEGVERKKQQKFFFTNVYFHPSPYGLWYQPIWIRTCGLKLIGEYKHEVMTVHEYPPFYNGIGARLILRRHKIRSVLEIHHIVGWPRLASFVERIGFWLSRLVLPSHARRFDAVRTVSRSNADVLASWGIERGRIRIVPSFYLDARSLRPDSSIGKKYDLVFCARLVKNKGLAFLLRALQGLQGTSLLVVGDGPEKQAMESLVASLGLRDRVTFSGWIAMRADLNRALQSARVFVLPSLSEGGPRVALEAMAIGMPVVATRVGVLPEVIEDGVNGVFTTGSPEDIRSVLASLLADADRRTAIGQRAQRVTERFERTRLIRGYAEFLT